MVYSDLIASLENSIESKLTISRENSEYYEMQNKIVKRKEEHSYAESFPELLKRGGTTKANSGGGGSGRSFRDKSRFLFTRAKAADSSGSLLAEVTNEAASATTTTSSLIGGATSPIRGVSPVGSGAGVETRANEDKSIIKLDDNFLDKPTGSKRDESDEQLTESQNNESIFTPSVPDSKSVETSVAPVPSSKEDPPLPNSSSSTASLSSKPLKLTRSHSSIITTTTSSPVQNGQPTIPEHLPTQESELTPILRVTTNSPPENDQAKTVQNSRESGYLNFDTIPLSPMASNAGVESSQATDISIVSQEKTKGVSKEDPLGEEVTSPSQMKTQQYSSTEDCTTDRRPEFSTTFS
ncbi:hypothetical protein MJO29_007230 [Puccinia striiformis f. sp. tritici]|uniref:Uncharacterized protein n=1 Tax=Puccinia striiformis f. sp. tritici PST-78 TaxID=1165861 RepID=A0A0L0VIQ3_9BASI|nr:hypothetical protein MJO29_007230 [Puccinia striiformis f. sp. tritici]KNE98864.1 hypothetical protein PSTG_07885 [Puccinia striiformis f. sp. tritici PST-78]